MDITTHADERMFQRGITKTMVRNAIKRGKITNARDGLKRASFKSEHGYRLEVVFSPKGKLITTYFKYI